MATLASALLLTAVTMAQADQMSDVLKLPPNKHHVYIFDVTSDASVEDLKAALGDFTVEGSYKVISNDTAAPHALAFPSGSVVTQHPAENVNEYAAMFEEEKALRKDEKLPDTVLLFLDREIKLSVTTCPEAFDMVMKKKHSFYTQEYEYVRKTKTLPVLNSYPPRMLFFSHVEENALQNVIKASLDKFEWYGSALVRTKRVVTV